MFIAELAEPDLDDYDLSSLRTGIMAGSPCPVEVMKQVVDRMNMSEVTIAYGMTETSPVSTQTSASDSLDKRVSTVGRAHPHVEIKIVDPEVLDEANLNRTTQPPRCGPGCQRLIVQPRRNSRPPMSAPVPNAGELL